MSYRPLRMKRTKRSDLGYTWGLDTVGTKSRNGNAAQNGRGGRKEAFSFEKPLQNEKRLEENFCYEFVMGENIACVEINKSVKVRDL